MNKYYVYILASKRNGTLYIGLTNELERRVIEHKNKQVRGFTAKYSVNRLVYFEEFENHNEAFIRERRLKKWKRAWKIKLIEGENPDWRDLAKDWDT
jgi:putative endonuclease